MINFTDLIFQKFLHFVFVLLFFFGQFTAFSGLDAQASEPMNQIQFKATLTDALGKPLAGTLNLVFQLGNFDDPNNEIVYFEKRFSKYALAAKYNGLINLKIDLSQNEASNPLNREQILAHANLQARLVLLKDTGAISKFAAQNIMPVVYAHRAQNADHADKVSPIGSTDIQAGSITAAHLAANALNGAVIS